MTRQSIALATLLSLFGTALWAANPEKERGPCFEPVQVLHIVDPVYPILITGIGTVILDVAIDESGAIADIDVTRGIPSLTEEAERAVRKWEFQPAKLDGKPVNGSIIVAFAFITCPYVGPSWVAPPQEEKQASFKPIQVVSTVEAPYPAQRRGSGTLTFEVRVDQSGAVGTLNVVHGIPSPLEAEGLVETAEETVRRWKFLPAKVDDKPMASPMIASFTFRVPVTRR